MQVALYISQTEKGKFVNSCEAVIRSVGSATKAATTQACQEIIQASLAQVPRDTGALASTAWYHVEAAIQGDGRVSSNRYVGYLGYAGHERTTQQVNQKIAASPDYESQGFMDLFPSYTTKFKQFQGQHHPGGSSWRRKRAGGGYTALGGYSGHGVQNAVNPKSGKPVSMYASIVHEDLDMPHPNGGKAKFLEDPIRDYAAAKFRRTLIHHWKYAIEWGNMYATRPNKTGTRNEFAAVFRSNSTIPTYFETSVIHAGSTSWKGGSL